jgi:hypothetical protein
MLWAVGIIVALIVVPVVIGFFLPVRYEGRTVVEFDKGVDAVWDALQDAQAHPMTGKMMKSITDLPDEEGRPSWQEDMGHGEIITVTTSVYESPHRMVREMSSASVNMTSRWEYALEQNGDGCRVTLSGVTDIEQGTWHTPVFRFMMFVGGGVSKGLDDQLDMLAATLGTEAQRPG